MSEPIPSSPSALPFIKNASLIRLKLMAIEVGEALDVAPEELPRTYTSVKSITTRIEKHYDLHFAVLKLSTGKGWRVVRVNSAEEAERFVPKWKKGKGGQKDEPVRIYNMTDAELILMIEAKIAFAKRDISDLTPRGITTAQLNTLETDNLNFGAMPDDVQLQGSESIAAEIKDAARTTLENRLGNLRNMADNTFGSGSVTYRAFRFEGMASEDDNRLLRLAKRAWREGTANQAAMATWGCTLAFLAQLQTDIETLDDEIDNVETAKTDRIKASVQRVSTGNNIYSRIEKICNTGKDVFRSTSEAKYNDYLIYS